MQFRQVGGVVCDEPVIVPLKIILLPAVVAAAVVPKGQVEEGAVLQPDGYCVAGAQ